MELYIKVKDGTIVDAKFKTFGCGAAIATSSMVTEMVKGKSIEEALKISNKAVAEALDGLPPIKMHCSVLAEESLGGITSLAEHPATMSHASMPEDYREKVGITDEVIRLSVGLENVDDLTEDLEQALSCL